MPHGLDLLMWIFGKSNPFRESDQKKSSPAALNEVDGGFFLKVIPNRGFLRAGLQGVDRTSFLHHSLFAA